MAETAAHLVDHVIPPLPARQWVLSVPKRLRWYLDREPQALSTVLRILLRVFEAHLCRSSGASARVNKADDVRKSVHFRAAAGLTPEAVAAITERVRIRVLRWFARSRLIEADDVREMLTWRCQRPAVLRVIRCLPPTNGGRGRRRSR